MKINKKTFCSIFIICLISGIVSAQQCVLKGKIINKDKQSVEIANVSLLRNETVVVGQAFTDSLGYFSLKAEKGKYHLVIGQFGIQYYKESLELSDDLDIGEIQIDISIGLKGITVIEKKTD